VADSSSWQLEIVPYLDASVRCVLEVPGDRTLEDLHQQILMAFSLPVLEGYAFFMNGDMDSPEFQYGPRVTGAAHDAEATRLDDLKLVPNKRFLYAFDEDEACAFDLKALQRGGPVPHAGRVVSTTGDLDDVFADMGFDEEDEDADEDAGVHHRAHGDHECGARHVDVAPELRALAARVRDRVQSWKAREEQRAAFEEDDDADPDAFPAEDPEAVASDGRLVDELLRLSNGDPVQIHVGVEHTVGESVWPWMMSVPGRLSEAGQHELAVACCRQIDGVAPIRVKLLKLPVYLARAGRRSEALAQIDENLRNAPEDMFALRYAGEALLQLGETQRAEEALREALHWAGGNLDLRGEILERLLPILVEQGRRADAERIVKDETRRFEEVVRALADEEDDDG
jgi:tetratricopeptide (TPR) repeat protein